MTGFVPCTKSHLCSVHDFGGGGWGGGVELAGRSLPFSMLLCSLCQLEVGNINR